MWFVCVHACAAYSYPHGGPGNAPKWHGLANGSSPGCVVETKLCPCVQANNRPNHSFLIQEQAAKPQVQLLPSPPFSVWFNWPQF